MTSQTAVAKIQVPVATEAANVPGDMLALAQSAERSMIPRFATAAARDAAITSAYRSADPSGFAGRGQRCYVDGSGPQIYTSSGWASDQPKSWSTTASDAVDYSDVAAATTTALMALVVPNAPVGVYHVSFVLGVGTAGATGTQARIPFVANTTTPLNAANGNYQLLSLAQQQQSVSWVGIYTNTSVQNLTFRLSILPTAQQARFYTAGSRIDAVFLAAS